MLRDYNELKSLALSVLEFTVKESKLTNLSWSISYWEETNFQINFRRCYGTKPEVFWLSKKQWVIREDLAYKLERRKLKGTRERDRPRRQTGRTLLTAPTEVGKLSWSDKESFQSAGSKMQRAAKYQLAVLSKHKNKNFKNDEVYIER